MAFQYIYAPRNRAGLHYSNTIDALNHEYQKGYRLIEIDMQLFDDTPLICFHDYLTFRYLTTVESITKLTLDEIQNVFINDPDYFNQDCTLGGLINFVEDKKDAIFFFDLKGFSFISHIYDNIGNMKWYQNLLFYLGYGYISKDTFSVENSFSNWMILQKRKIVNYIFGYDEEFTVNKMYNLIENISEQLSLNAKKRVIPAFKACDHLDIHGKSFFEKIQSLGFESVQCEFGNNFYEHINGDHIYEWLSSLNLKQRQSVIFAFAATFLDNQEFSKFIYDIKNKFSIKTMTFSFDSGMREDEMQDFINLNLQHNIDYFPNGLLYPKDSVYKKIPFEIKFKYDSNPIINITNLSNCDIRIDDWYMTIASSKKVYNLKNQTIENGNNLSIKLIEETMEQSCNSYSCEFENEKVIAPILSASDSIYLRDKSDVLLAECKFYNQPFDFNVKCRFYIYILKDLISNCSYPEIQIKQLEQEKILQIKALPNPISGKEYIKITNIGYKEIDLAGYHIKGRVSGWDCKLENILRANDSIYINFKECEKNLIVDHVKTFLAINRPFSSYDRQSESQFADFAHSNLSNYIDNIRIYDDKDNIITDCSYRNPIEDEIITCVSVL